MSIGRSRGGLSTKIHASCNKNGKPVQFFLTCGQSSDYTKALDLIHNKKMNVLIADKGYDANYLIEKAESIGAKTVIPPRSMRKNPRFYDKDLYKHHNIIERMFNKMKQFRRVATRYDKLDISHISFVLFSGICLWLK